MSRRAMFAGVGTLAAIGLFVQVVRAQQICGEWSEVAPPAGATGAIIEVTALSAADAWALNDGLETIHWDGAGWSQVPLPDLSYPFDLRATGSAGTAMFVSGILATGTWTTEQLLLIWDGGDWDRVESLELARNTFGQPRYGAPRAVDGISAGDLWIVGTASAGPPGGGNVVLTVHWDGSQLIEYITEGLGDRQNHLYDVSALAPDDAWAVGYWTSWVPPENGLPHGQTFHWDGTGWNHVPNPTEAIDNVHLRAVEAIAPDDVWAAGYGPGLGPLFMHWDGTSWTIVPSPATLGTIEELAAIASDDIWAVDWEKYYHWDGTEWTIVIPPVVPGGTQVSRKGLAAAGECDVWAVGRSDDGQVLGPFIERLQAGSGATDAPLVAVGGSFLGVAPNPTRQSTQIRLQIPGDSLDRARIYDVRGQLVRKLLDRPQGSDLRLSWDGRDDLGRPVSGGVYFLRVDSSEGLVLTRKVTVVR